ncbi:MAG: primase C-terminal domain-containing protein [Planctomycetota bacterium]|nr:primase C-terminal domain-containing protein [Planctomycetota bacterium]
MNDNQSPAGCEKHDKSFEKQIPKSKVVPVKSHNAKRPKTGKRKKPSESGNGKKFTQERRNSTLLEKACVLQKLELPADTIVTRLLDLNEQLCNPPLPKSEVRAIAKSAAESASNSADDFVSRLTQDIEFWHDENDDPFATLPQGGHRENWLVGSRSNPPRCNRCCPGLAGHRSRFAYRNEETYISPFR